MRKQDLLQTEKARQIFQQHGKKITRKKGSIIMSPFLKSDYYFFVGSGDVIVYFIHPNGDKQLLTILNKGSMFAKLYKLRPGLRNELYYETLNNAELYILEENVFQKHYAKEPYLKMAMFDQIVLVMLWNIDVRICKGAQTVHQKVVIFLFLLLNYYNQKSLTDCLIEPYLTNDQIAEFLNITQVSVSKSICTLKKKQLIKIKNRRLIIINIKDYIRYMEEIEAWEGNDPGRPLIEKYLIKS